VVSWSVGLVRVSNVKVATTQIRSQIGLSVVNKVLYIVSFHHSFISCLDKIVCLSRGVSSGFISSGYLITAITLEAWVAVALQCVV